MARARINADGTGVRLGLSFREAAALYALLTRIDDSTNADINEATVGLYFALSDVQDTVLTEDRRLWPDDFADFGCRESPLVDDEAED